ncbi:MULTISPECIES: saccharopine dehydrogenase C-terminal domain-containing protein [Altibacter]|uniref:saccharopine dehydrogenase family protein n=1 Tax=Altibacter TaxID=1535231 RepID=UPI000551409A|nr:MULTISPECIES: saccharopine dehydrogenase C-terminal domain-containing protein [Altibacter]MCW8979974.1 saccharopine dehydrogenase NADP-binding domain-containing protein [Altibacter sp.]MCW9038798.1 saccharopine dehydrogenase NADP-binding domain-containing protein [Altibacter sp.]
MRNILIIGAGRSATSLIQYLLDRSEAEELFITIGDISIQNAQKFTDGHPNARGILLDVFNESQRRRAVENSDLVISMLPARYHIEVAKDCIEFGKHLVTASYVSDQMQSLDTRAKAKGLVFMNEIGLDPGIDHMSAMQVIDRIRAKGGKMLLFESFTGGLIAPESDDNLWHYKFTWNPRNVVLAGQGGAAEFIQEGTYKYIPYHRLFRRTEFLDVEGHGRFEAYANRNSLKYRKVYGLEDVLTLYRGTIRHVGFSKAWNMFVQLGMTDDDYTIPNSEALSYRNFVNLFLPYSPTDSVELKLRHNLKIDQDDLMWGKLEELDIFNSEKKIGIKDATPAQALQRILEDKWTLKADDKDMIVMYHKFGYELNGAKYQIDSNMVIKGDDQSYTAMAKTVGLPVAIAALKILNEEITTPGVQLPIAKEVYEPILKELEDFGISFTESDVPYLGYNPNNVAG